MPDISLCLNTTCPSNKYCYRFTATPNEYKQAYASFTLEDDEMSCSHFWSNGVNSDKCKNVRHEGATCSSSECNYPKCVDDTYCPKCHQTGGNHKISCPTMKIQVNL